MLGSCTLTRLSEYAETTTDSSVLNDNNSIRFIVV